MSYRNHNFNQTETCIQCDLTYYQAQDPKTGMLGTCIPKIPISMGSTLTILGELLEEGIIEEVNRLDGKIGYRVIKRLKDER